MLDGVEFGKEIVDLVRGYVEREIGPLKSANEALQVRLAELEARPAPEKGEQGERGLDGVAPEPEAIAETLTERLKAMVDEAVAAIPPADAGPPGEKGEAGERGADGQNGADGNDGVDGVGLAGALIDRAGHLRVRMTNGTDHDLGPVIGKDGEPGRDGNDGLGFDDMDACVLDDDRTIELSFRRGDEEKAFTFKWPSMVYRGVWSEGTTYQPGDVVTWGGSAHVAERETDGKPDTKDSGFRLAVKRGRDGKDAKVG